MEMNTEQVASFGYNLTNYFTAYKIKGFPMTEPSVNLFEWDDNSGKIKPTVHYL